MKRGHLALLVAVLIGFLVLSVGPGVVGAQQEGAYGGDVSAYDVTLSQTDDVEIVDTEFKVLNKGPGTGGDSTSVEYDDDNFTVTVEGRTVGSNSCYTAQLKDASYDSGDETLHVDIGTWIKFGDGIEACAQVITVIQYRVVVTFEGGLPQKTEVTTSDTPPLPEPPEAPDCSGVTYAGDGTASNPYEVGNVDQLQCINETGLDANYVQVSDIDASETSLWNGGSGFKPIGESPVDGPPFNGTFHGQGYNVSGLTINRSTEYDIGLFGFVGSAGEVTNASIVNADIDGDYIVGGLIGNNKGTVTQSHASGSVNGYGGVSGVGGLIGSNIGGEVSESYASSNVSGVFRVGGLIGLSDEGEISESYATGDVSGEKEVGGLVGANSETVTNSYATGDVTGIFRVGGLFGITSAEVNESYATGDVYGNQSVGGFAGLSFSNVTKSYATGDVTGNNGVVGGLIGINSGRVKQSYARGDVSSEEVVGGLVAVNEDQVTNSYATGEVNASSEVGGLIGINGEVAYVHRNGSDGVLRDSYWDTETTNQTDAIGKEGGTDREGNEGGDSIVQGEVQGLTTSQMTGSNSSDNMTVFDFTTTWENVTNPDDYPVLSDDGGMGVYRTAQGDVELSGLQSAIDDYIAGDIELSLLQDVIDEFVQS